MASEKNTAGTVVRSETRERRAILFELGNVAVDGRKIAFEVMKEAPGGQRHQA